MSATRRRRAAWLLPRAQERRDRVRREPVLVLGGEAEILQADHLALVHLDAAADLGEVFAEGDLQDQLLDLAEVAGRLQLLRPGCIWRSAST